ncbi:MAG TPA: alpha-L-arabinofuranosidase C-terminal domain-containing protein [Candidatus Dormibacteraeota bacterium]|nr:alpha-L-arabinofuranosidase C-terminal domain-containing protein [Candidatus Dormibacteraeota bacterium]
MTARARLSVDRQRRRGAIDPQIYGQFVEHVGRAVYGGIFDPDAPGAEEGRRADVLAAVGELRPTVLRWPGGNFASGYHWRDGVGPVEQRPTRHDLAWDAVETNRFGTEELLAFTRAVGAAPYLNLNLSTGTADEALGWLEYTNGTADLPEVLLRRAGPHPEPHGVRLWGLGNENYGWWQHGHSGAAAYAERAREWGKLLRWTDRSVRLVGVGAPDPDWNWTVLSDAGRFIDHLSLHFYWHGNLDDPYHSILAGPLDAERDIEAAWGMCVAAQRKLGLQQPVTLAVDEWGVWAETYRPLVGTLSLDALMRSGFSARSGIDTHFEESYDLKDALAVATWLHVLWRHPEKVTLATQAQMVNVLAPIMVTPHGVVRQTVFHPVAVARGCAGDVAVDAHVATDDATGGMAVLDAAATLDARSGRLHVSMVNRHRDEELEVTLPDLRGRARRITLWHESDAARNTADAPSAVVPRCDDVDLDGALTLPPHSHVSLVLGG